MRAINTECLILCDCYHRNISVSVYLRISKINVSREMLKLCHLETICELQKKKDFTLTNVPDTTDSGLWSVKTQDQY